MDYQRKTNGYDKKERSDDGAIGRKGFMQSAAGLFAVVARPMVLGGLAAILTSGCIASQTRPEPVLVSYRSASENNYSVVYESERTKQTVQFGLDHFSEWQKLIDGDRQGPIRVDDQEKFFPFYHALVNQDVSDGNMLYISQSEADWFAQVTFRAYQDRVTPDEFKKMLNQRSSINLSPIREEHRL